MICDLGNLARNCPAQTFEKMGAETWGLCCIASFSNRLCHVITMLKHGGPQMLTSLRKIGNSRGLIIPSAFLEQLRIENEVELILGDGVLLIKPVAPLRQGWFEGYDPNKDIEPLAELQELDSEQEDWEW